jgi:hypoxanthine phosphoribosyltransferase
MDTLNIIFGIITIISFIVTIYYGRKSIRLEKEKKTLDWADLQASANDLSTSIKNSGFIPEIIFTPGLRGATFANLLQEEFDSINAPVFVGLSIWKKGGKTLNDTSDFEVIETNKWQVLIPKSLFKLSDKKILIVDDFAMSGDFLQNLKKILLVNGFQNPNIKTATIAATTVAIQNGKGPDFNWIEPSDSSFYFPWGKAK